MKKLLLSALLLSAGVASAQWDMQATGFDAPSRGINEIDIVDANTVWAVAYDGITPTNEIQEFTRTTDGGENWIAGFIDTGGLPINNLSAIDGETAWVSSIDGNAGGGMLFKTNDGGFIWEPANPGVGANFTNAASFQNFVHFFDSQTGIVGGDPIGSGNGQWEVYRTTNGGESWTQLGGWSGALAAITNEFGYNGGNVGAGENFFWFVTSRGYLYRTADKGATWSKFNTPIADFGGVVTTTSNGRVHFSDINGDINSAVGVLIATANSGTSYTRYTTTDGGATWSAGTPYTAPYQNIDFIPGSNVLVGVATGATSYLSAYSTDLGATWIEISSDLEQKTTVAFLDGSTGWAGGFNEDSSTGGMYKYSGPALRVSEVAARTQFTATPNPTSGMLSVANENANITNVVVVDLLGKQVYSGKFNALNQVDLDLTPLTAGAYILTATADNGAQQTIKIMKN